MKFKVGFIFLLGMLTGTIATMLLTNAMADEASLQRQLDAQQRTMNAQQNQIYQLQQDIATLRGELEQLRYLASRQGGASSLNNNTVVNLPVGNTPSAAPAAPSNNAASSSTGKLAGVTDESRKAYNDAYAKVQNNDLNGAAAAFKTYVEKYPDNALTPNAWYWLGQVQYSQANYEQARLSFLNVARFADSQKRPDALYKLGMISKFLGDKDKATRYFQLVVQTYPNDAAATLSSRELQRLK